MTHPALDFSAGFPKNGPGHQGHPGARPLQSLATLHGFDIGTSSAALSAKYETICSSLESVQSAKSGAPKGAKSAEIGSFFEQIENASAFGLMPCAHCSYGKEQTVWLITIHTVMRPANAMITWIMKPALARAGFGQLSFWSLLWPLLPSARPAAETALRPTQMLQLEQQTWRLRHRRLPANKTRHLLESSGPLVAAFQHAKIRNHSDLNRACSDLYAQPRNWESTRRRCNVLLTLVRSRRGSSAIAANSRGSSQESSEPWPWGRSRRLSRQETRLILGHRRQSRCIPTFDLGDPSPGRASAC